MKVSKLIKALKEFEETHGDLEVKIITDHGQQHFSADSVKLAGTEEVSSWMSEPFNVDDEDVEDMDFVCEIG